MGTVASYSGGSLVYYSSEDSYSDSDEEEEAPALEQNPSNNTYYDLKSPSNQVNVYRNPLNVEAKAEQRVGTYNQTFEAYYGSKINSKGKRAWKFAVQKIVTLLFNDSSFPIFVCAGGGAATGAVIGGLITGGPGVIPGAIGGGTFGFVIGVIISAQLTRSDYINWKRQERNQEFMQQFVEFHQSHSVLSNFICPISQQPFDDPVITPGGHTYNREGVVRWIKEMSTDPITKKPLAIEQLTPDYIMLGKMAVAYEAIISEESNLEGLSKEAQLGLQAVSRHMKKQIKLTYETAIEQVTFKYKEGKITMEEHAELPAIPWTTWPSG